MIAVEFLVSRGHPFERIWHTYTPRQVFAFYEAARRNREQELAENLIVTALGAQGEQKAIEAQLEQWQ